MSAGNVTTPNRMHCYYADFLIAVPDRLLHHAGPAPRCFRVHPPSTTYSPRQVQGQRFGLTSALENLPR